MNPLQLERQERWCGHPEIAPVAAPDDAGVTLSANRTRACAGGWQWVFSGVVPQQAYRLRITARHEGLLEPRDTLRCVVHWTDVPATELRVQPVQHEFLPPRLEPGLIEFERVVVAPPGATRLTFRAVFRWSEVGGSQWTSPEIELAPAPAPRPAVRVGVVTGTLAGRTGSWTIARNVDHYRDLCERAAVDDPDLIVLPEIALQWGVPGHPIEQALPLDSPEVGVFRELALRHHARICLGLIERDGDAVRNAAALISPEGEVDGVYHKVHLAEGGEDISGILPGDSFPVFATELGRLGCNICMDSSCAESSRMVGLNGADFLLLPIMGDHRASRWSPGSPIFNHSRWRAIQRTHAIDNQLCLVACRNVGEASCIIDRRGDILAWNEGDRDWITAEVKLDDGYRGWTGACFKDVNWLQRRPQVYGATTEQGNLGSLATPARQQPVPKG